MADSTLKTFYTTSGREVLEGRGVLPDVEVPSPAINYVLQGLLENGVLFDFAVRQREVLDAPEDAAEFALDEATWNAFIAYVAALEEVPYASQTLQAFESLEAIAKEELLDEMNEKALITLKSGLQADVPVDLKTHQTEVRRALEQELVVHLYNTSGVYKHGLVHDPVALRAVALLETGEYVSILTGPEAAN